MEQTFEIGGQKFTRSAMDGVDRDRVQEILKNFRRKVGLLCVSVEPSAAVSVRRVKDKYYLVHSPNTDLRHASKCPSFETRFATRPTMAISSRRAIWRDQDNVVHIRLDKRLLMRHTGPAGPATGRRIGRGGIKRNARSLLGVMRTIWEEVELNFWGPGYLRTRRWRVVRGRVLDFAGKSILNNQQLSKILFIPAQYEYGGRRDPNHDFRVLMNRAAVRNLDASRFALLLGEVQSAQKDAEGLVIRIKNLEDCKFVADEETRPELEASFHRESNKVKVTKPLNRRGRILGLFVVGFDTKPDNYSVHGFGLMPVSKQWIPVESSNEFRIARQLVKEDRVFRKPVAYYGECTFPDFVLLDTEEKEYLMEVFGMVGYKRYDKRKEEKIMIYKDSGIKVWSWDPKKEKTYTPFPPKSR